VPSRRSRALVAGCLLAGLSAGAAWAASDDDASSSAHAAAQATTSRASMSSAMAAEHDKRMLPARAPSPRADRGLTRSALVPISPAAQALAPPAAAEPPASVVEATVTTPALTSASSAPTLDDQAAAVMLTLDQQAAALRQRVKDAAAAAAAAAKAKAAAAAAKAEAEALAQAHRWVRPNSAALSSPFGRRWGRMHEGIDLAGAYGSPILAATSGTVTYAGPESGYGEIVKITDWDGTQTWYGHMSKFLVKAGDKVTPGQEIALVGAAGDATGPHLHFEVHVNGQVVDPIPFLAARGIHI